MPSPTRSHGAISPNRNQPRFSRSVGSPASSTTSTRLASVVKDVLEISPMLKRRSVLNDGSDIIVPGRKSWWKHLGENSREVLDVLQNKDMVEAVNVLEDLDVEVLSQENKNYSVDLQDSSDGESIKSIVVPHRKLFTERENVAQKTFNDIIKTINKTDTQKSSVLSDKDFNIAPKNLFQREEKRPKPVFPAALLSISANKTMTDKTLPPVEPQFQRRNLFGNRPAGKPRNMFVDFIVSDSEDEIPDIQPKIFTLKRHSLQKQRGNSMSHLNSPTASITDIDMDDWKLLPSSTMMEHQFEDQTTPKQPRHKRRSGVNQKHNTSDVKQGKNDNTNSMDFDAEEAANLTLVGENPYNVEQILTTSKAVNQSKNRSNVSKRHASNKSLTKIQENEVEKSEQNKSINEPKENLENQPKTVIRDLNKINNRKQNASQAANTVHYKSAEIEGNLEYKEKMMEHQFEDQTTPKQPRRKRRSGVNQKHNTSDVKQGENDNTSSMDFDVEEAANLTLVGENPYNVEQILTTSKAVNQSKNRSNVSKRHASNKSLTKIQENEVKKSEQNKSNNEPKENLENQSKTVIRDLYKINNKKQNASQAANTAHYKSAEIEGNLEYKEKTDTDSSKDELENSQLRYEEDVANDETIRNILEQSVQNSVGDQNKTKSQVLNIANKSKNLYQIIQDDTSNKKKQELRQSLNKSKQGAKQDDFLPEDNGSSKIHVESSPIEENHCIQENNKIIAVQRNQDSKEDNEQEQQRNYKNIKENNDVEQEIKDYINMEQDHEVLQDLEESEFVHEEESEVEQENSQLEQEESEIEQEANQAEQENEESAVEQEIEESEAEHQESRSEQDKEESAVEQEQEESEAEHDESRSEQDNEESAVEQEIEESEAEHQESRSEQDNEESAVEQEQEESEAEHEESRSEQDNEESEIEQEQEETENEQENDYIDVDVSENEPEVQELGGYQDKSTDHVGSYVGENNEPSAEISNSIHDISDKNKNETVKSPEAVLQNKTMVDLQTLIKGRNTSVRKTKSITMSHVPISKFQTEFAEGSRDSSANNSGWDSHRTTRKTMRQTFGKNFTPRKSLRTLVMEKSAKRQTNLHDNEDISKMPQANSTEYPQFETLSEPMDVEESAIEESDHEISKRTRQTTLEMYLQKVKSDNMERKRKIQEQVMNSLKATQNTNVFKMPQKAAIKRTTKTNNYPKTKRGNHFISLAMLPEDVLEDLKYKPPKRYQPKNAAWVTKRLYKFLEMKLEPKYDYKARVRAEKLVEIIYNFTRDIRRCEVAPEHLVNSLKHEMARLNIVHTHHEFYEFFQNFLPRDVRVKVIPDIVNKIPVPKPDVFGPIIQ